MEKNHTTDPENPNQIFVCSTCGSIAATKKSADECCQIKWIKEEN